MNYAKIRARLTAMSLKRFVHIHGCFGEVDMSRADYEGYGYCLACERKVDEAEVVSPFPKFYDYDNDVSTLLTALDAAEERLADLEEESRTS
jgi:hypothetical protein